MFKKTRRFLSCALAACSVMACAGTLTACETNNPEVEMQIEFNDETYTLNYTMSRKVTPNTVKHFLWLVEGGFYDNTVIHDYNADSLKMYGGLYDYVTEEGKDYYSQDKSYKAYFEAHKDTFNNSVFLTKGEESPLSTLYGEFKSNGYEVKKGTLSESFGSLVMYYNDKNTEENIYVKRVDGDGYSSRQYEYNSATSMFYVNLATSSKTQEDYCVFANLDEDSKVVLENLQQAITDYIDEYYLGETEDFTTITSMNVDKEDHFVGNLDNTVIFRIPNKPIVIKYVKVTKF